MQESSVSGSPLLFQVNNPALNSNLVLNADDHISGDPAASVVLIEYLDFGCPHCAVAHPLVQQMEQQFAGDLLVVRRHFPVITATSPHAGAGGGSGSSPGSLR